MSANKNIPQKSRIRMALDFTTVALEIGRQWGNVLKIFRKNVF